MIMKKENVFIGGAVFAAIASTLCCVLPLVAVLFGVGAFGAASAFDTLRPYLLVLVFTALAFNFYRIYFRREECAEGKACATKPVNKINQLFLWVGLLVISAFDFAPYCTGYLMAATGNSQSSNLVLWKAMFVRKLNAPAQTPLQSKSHNL